jgi:hypothetical protein
MKRSAFHYFAVFSLVCTLSVHSESIRGELADGITAGKSGDHEARLLLGQFSTIEIADPVELIQGIEIEIDVPENIRAYRDSFALYVFHEMDRKPEKGQKAFSGSQVMFELVPSIPRFFLRFPLRQGVSYSSSADTISSKKTLSPEGFPLLIGVFPMMKGLPPKLLESVFTVKARPIYENKGMLNLSILPEGVQPKLIVDGKEVQSTEMPLILSTGIHQVSVEAHGYKREDISFGIEKGESTELTVKLERSTSFLVIEAPDNAGVYIDGAKISFPGQSRFEVQEGEHVVLFRLGDYRLSKKMQIIPGKTYKISLFLDILVQED